MESVTITRRDHGDSGEYRAKVEGSPHFGRLTWITREGARVVEHTIVPPEIGGRGIAAQLVQALIKDARAQQFRIVPECSYVAAAFAKHPEWADLRAA
ncbi:MAG: GNAT family N-acetyltransferase [Novosphingobium sp.]